MRASGKTPVANCFSSVKVSSQRRGDRRAYSSQKGLDFRFGWSVSVAVPIMACLAGIGNEDLELVRVAVSGIFLTACRTGVNPYEISYLCFGHGFNSGA